MFEIFNKLEFRWPTFKSKHYYNNPFLIITISYKKKYILGSDFPPTKLSELHGNRNLEICKKCGAKYMRDFRTRSALGVNDH